MRTAGLLLVLVLLGLSARAEGFRSPGGVLQLAQHAAREAALLASGGTSAEAWDTEELGSIQAREAEWSHTAASSQVAEAVLPELSASPWFCHGIDCPGFQVDDNFHLEEMETVERRTYDASKWVSVRVKGVSYDKAMYDGFMVRGRPAVTSPIASAHHSRRIFVSIFCSTDTASPISPCSRPFAASSCLESGRSRMSGLGFAGAGTHLVTSNQFVTLGRVAPVPIQVDSPLLACDDAP